MNYFERKNDKTKIEARKSLMAKITVITFFVILLWGFLFIIVLPKPTVSAYERRELAKFPEFSFYDLISGEYTKSINLYIADTFPFREALVEAGVHFDEAKGIRFDNVKLYGSDIIQPQEAQLPVQTAAQKTAPPVTTTMPPTDTKPLQTNETRPVETLPPQTEPAPLTYSFDDVPDITGEQNGNVFVVGDMGLDLFGGIFSIGESYANVLNAYRSRLPESVNLYNIIVPTHSEFALPKRYRNMANSQKDGIENIYSYLGSGITPVNIYDALYTHKDEYTYFRTDHHWTALGAYYAYEQFAAALGVVSIKREDLEYGKIDTFLGSFYSSTRDINMRNNPDYVEYFRPHDVRDYDLIHYLADGNIYTGGGLVSSGVGGDTSAGYLIFISGDQPHTHISTPNKNGRKLMVFKESFGNAFVPFAAMHYEEVHVADIRSFPHNSVNFIIENEIDDVLFINNIFAAYTPVRISDIEGLMNK